MDIPEPCGGLQEVGKRSTSDSDGITIYPKFCVQINMRKDNPSTQNNHEDTKLSILEERGPSDGGQNSDTLPIAQRKGKCNSVKPLPYDIALFLHYNKVSPVYKSFLTILNQTIIPKTAEAALMYPYWKKKNE